MDRTVNESAGTIGHVPAGLREMLGSVAAKIDCVEAADTALNAARCELRAARDTRILASSLLDSRIRAKEFDAQAVAQARAELSSAEAAEQDTLIAVRVAYDAYNRELEAAAELYGALKTLKGRVFRTMSAAVRGRACQYAAVHGVTQYAGDRETAFVRKLGEQISEEPAGLVVWDHQGEAQFRDAFRRRNVHYGAPMMGFLAMPFDEWMAGSAS
jgi:hypothetical protein